MGLPRGLARRLAGWARFRAVAANVPPLTIKNSRREEDMIPPGADVGSGLVVRAGQIVAEFGRNCSPVRLRDAEFGFVRRNVASGGGARYFAAASGDGLIGGVGEPDVATKKA